MLMFPCNANAGSLTISGSSNISTAIEGSLVKITGTYQLENKGTEDSINVYPAFKFGSWGWSGEARNLSRNAKEVWEINTNFEVALLGQDSITSKGHFPLQVLRHYEDLNGVHFSAADIIPITVGQISESEINSMRTPEVNGNFSCDGNGQLFSCKLELLNTSDSAKTLTVSYHSSQEIQLNTTAATVEVGPRQKQSVESDIENFSGLPGSGYAVFAIIQWKNATIHKFKSVATVVKLKNPDRFGMFLGIGLGIFIISILSVYLFVFRPSPRKPKPAK
jgi:hypothetical protein